MIIYDLILENDNQTYHKYYRHAIFINWYEKYLSWSEAQHVVATSSRNVKDLNDSFITSVESE